MGIFKAVGAANNARKAVLKGNYGSAQLHLTNAAHEVSQGKFLGNRPIGQAAKQIADRGVDAFNNAPRNRGQSFSTGQQGAKSHQHSDGGPQNYSTKWAGNAPSGGAMNMLNNHFTPGKGIDLGGVARQMHVEGKVFDAKLNAARDKIRGVQIRQHHEALQAHHDFQEAKAGNRGVVRKFAANGLDKVAKRFGVDMNETPVDHGASNRDLW